MIDFEKLRKGRGTSSKPIDPVELFYRLPRSTYINDLWKSQADALKEWNDKKQNKDIIIKLNTGGGKTLVGLLIAQCISNETNGSVLYLCPTVQLVQQTYDLSKNYGFKTVVYQRGPYDLNSDFLNGKSIMIATYSALFNGISKFGTIERKGDCIPLEGIILDDAHTAFSDIRNHFTLSIKNDANNDLYLELCNLFRGDFDKIGRLPTFDDILLKKDPYILEVPYWSWKSRANEIRSRLSKDIADDQRYKYIWPLIRDEFDYCHALINHRSFSITPLYPMIDKFPSFSECRRRVYMSATLADDSSIIRTFDAELKSVSEPIISKSLTGVGERMILAPNLMKNISGSDIPEIVKNLCKDISERNLGVIILVPSSKASEKWKDIAKIPSNSEEVAEYISNLKTGKSYGPYVFVNRYDGLDLPGNSCRLLVMDGKPIGDNIYDSFRYQSLGNSREMNSSSAQRIEQGIGRGTRGSGDYCVAILLGNDLISWISRESYRKQLTQSTQAQLEIGTTISKDVVGSLEDFKEIINKCLERDQDWVEYHADGLAESLKPAEVNKLNLRIAASERKHLELLRNNNHNDAIATINQYLDAKMDISEEMKGWLSQLTARAFYFWGDKEKASEYQRKAYSLNKNLLKPLAEPPYETLPTPGKQSLEIVKSLKDYKERRGYLLEFDQILSGLNATASSNQFEESLRKLGIILGFQAERPDHDIRKGPDVLWILNENCALVIEVKSNKKSGNVLTKEEYGQLLTSYEWFESKYPTHKGIKVIVHPNKYTSKSISNKGFYALTLDNLNTLISNTNILLDELCNSSASYEKLIAICEKKVKELNLTPERIIANLLVTFEVFAK